MNNKNNLAKQLKQFRKTQNLTQVQLASKLGCHPNTLAKWEQGKQNIRHPKLVKLALDELTK